MLRLEVEGIGDAFVVAPLAAKRGKALTEAFIEAAIGNGSEIRTAQIFIEAFGPANYSRMSGSYVDEYDDAGAPLRTHGPNGVEGDTMPPAQEPIALGVRFVERAGDDLGGEAIRQEEAEALCLAAFYWQTVVGIEGVQQFLDEGATATASLKILNLLLFRLGISPSPTSQSSALELRMRQDDTRAISTPPNGGTHAQRPHDKHANSGSVKTRRDWLRRHRT